MKIQATNTVPRSARSKGKPKAGGDFGVADPQEMGKDEVSQLNSSPVLGTLIELQGGTKDHDQATLSWSADILDSLEKLQYGLLTGALSNEALRALVRQVERSPSESMNAELSAIRSHILLRARVELAKHISPE